LEGSIGFVKRSHFTSEQIVFALRQAESGAPIAGVCRKMGIVEQTFYRWKKRYIGMSVAEVRRHISACRRMIRASASYPNESWFFSLEDAKEKVEEWRRHYNHERPHGSLGNIPSVEFAGAQVAK
jgi:transposase InsO family protein